MKINFKVIIIIMAMILFMVVLAFVMDWAWKINSELTKEMRECLEPIAKKVCEEKGLVYDSHHIYYGRIYCVGDERSLDWITYKFHDEELERCGI